MLTQPVANFSQYYKQSNTGWFWVSNVLVTPFLLDCYSSKFELNLQVSPAECPSISKHLHHNTAKLRGKGHPV